MSALVATETADLEAPPRRRGFPGVALIRSTHGLQRAMLLSGLVVIGLGSCGDLQPPQHVMALLNKVNVPIFDLYGRDDSPDVLSGAAQRLTAAARINTQHAGGAPDIKPGRPFYRQLGLLGAGHAFADQTPMVIQFVYGWLKTHAGNAEKTATP